MERIDKKIQIVIDHPDRRDLHNQLENMFIEADHETTRGMYSGSNIERKYPKIWELFKLICV